MNAQLEHEIATATAWLRTEAPRIGFGAIGVTLTLHGGRVTKCERVVQETRKPGNGDDYVNARS